MIVFGQIMLYSGKMVVFGQKCGILAKSLFSVKNGCICAELFFFGQKWLYLGKSCVSCAKVFVLGQSGCIWAKVVVFLKSCFIRAR